MLPKYFKDKHKAIQKTYKIESFCFLNDPKILMMKDYPHHGKVSCYVHSERVARYSYIVSKWLKLDHQSVLNGAILHDYYLYDRYKNSPGLHGLKHSKIALFKATKDFDLNIIEKDIIRTHMFPLTPTIPRYKESFVVLCVDKVVATLEYLKG